MATRKQAPALFMPSTPPTPTEPTAISAMALFEDCTYLGHDEKWKNIVYERCWDQGYIAFIDYDEDMGWVFHSLHCPDCTMSKKLILSEYFEKRRRRQRKAVTEAEFEGFLCLALGEIGSPHKRQVRCDAGIIDVVTITSIVEVKLIDTLFHAIGQVLAYRASFDQSRKAVIIARSATEAAKWNSRFCPALGIEVLIWDGVSTDIVRHL